MTRTVFILISIIGLISLFEPNSFSKNRFNVLAWGDNYKLLNADSFYIGLDDFGASMLYSTNDSAPKIIDNYGLIFPR